MSPALILYCFLSLRQFITRYNSTRYANSARETPLTRYYE